MTDTVDDVDFPYEDGASQQEKVETLEERLEAHERAGETDERMENGAATRDRTDGEGVR